jgi:hypothetical protein
MDLLDLIPVIPKEGKERIRAALNDNEIVRDMDTIISAATPLFENASRNPAADQSLRDVFNNVSAVLPAIKKYVVERKTPKLSAAKVGWNFKKLIDNGDILEDAFNKQNPAVKEGIIDPLLDNTEVQNALVRILSKPAGQGLFTLQKDGEQGYAVEQLSGTKIPLPEDNYKKIEAIVKKAQPGPNS